ncbi:hypothetical protein LZK82_11140 [Rhizobium leguminosarum]|nr:hypothetical protein LZK82_11140 [Rhizobium leguminosarum]
MSRELISGGEYRALSKRGITEETCRKFGYQIGHFKDQLVHIAPYYDDEETSRRRRYASLTRPSRSPAT